MLLSFNRFKLFFSVLNQLLVVRKAKLIPSMKRCLKLMSSLSRLDHAKKDGGTLILDEGPIGYMLTVGCFGQSWSQWLSVLFPGCRDFKLIFVFLAVSDNELASRRERRLSLTGRDYRSEADPATGRICDSQKAFGRGYWQKALSNFGARVIEIDTTGLTSDEVAENLIIALQDIVRH